MIFLGIENQKWGNECVCVLLHWCIISVITKKLSSITNGEPNGKTSYFKAYAIQNGSIPNTLLRFV